MKTPSLPGLIPVFSKLQDFSRRILPFWFAASLTALMSVIYAKAFAYSEGIAMGWTEAHPVWAFVITPLALLTATALAFFLAPTASGSGIPQLIAAVELAKDRGVFFERLLSVPMIIVKFLGSCISIAGGGVTGREGPMLQISAGIFRKVYKYWPDAKANITMQSIVLAGGAAGLASAFNTPLGGIVFAIEELAKVHISSIRTTVFHSVIIAGLIAQALMGNYLYFGKFSVAPIEGWEIIPICIAAIIIGICGAVFGAAIVRTLDWRAKLPTLTKFAMTLVCGLFVAGLFFLIGPQALGSGRHVIVDLLAHPDIHASFEVGAGRLFGNFFTYVSGTPGGVFAPALSTGAALGSFLGGLLPESHPQLWILAGMVAFLTGVTRTPFTSAILVFEMTDSHNVIIYLMLAAIFAQGAAQLIDPVSFYEHMAGRILHQAEAQTEKMSLPT